MVDLEKNRSLINKNKNASRVAPLKRALEETTNELEAHYKVVSEYKKVVEETFNLAEGIRSYAQEPFLTHKAQIDSFHDLLTNKSGQHPKSLIQEVDEAKKQISGIQTDSINYQSTLLGDGENSTKSKIATFESEIEKVYKDWIEKVEGKESSKKELLNQSYAEIMEAYGKIIDKGQEGLSVKDEIYSFHDELFAEDKDNPKNISTSKYIRETRKGIEEAHSKLLDGDQSLVNKIMRHESFIKKTEASIKDLLPKSATAGLAAAYCEAKSEYKISKPGFRSGKKRPEKESWLGWHSAHLAVNFFRNLYNISLIMLEFSKHSLPYVFFIAPIALIVIGGYDTFNSINDNKIGTLNVWQYLTLRSIMALPLMIVSLFGYSSITLNRKLFEIYNHKQRVLQLYEGFKERIEKEGNEELKQKLLEIMLLTVYDKPSSMVNKYDSNQYLDLFKKVFKFQEDSPE